VRVLKRVGRDNAEKNKQPIFTKETFGVVLMLFATLALVCLITGETIFSTPGKFVREFLLGVFGLFAYPVTFWVLFMGVLLFTDKKTGLNSKRKLLLFGILFSVALLAHVISMRDYASLSYGEYLSRSYTLAGGGFASCSGGGVITGLLAYCFSAILSTVGSYVVISAIIAALIYVFVKDVSQSYKRSGADRRTEFNSSFVPEENASNDVLDGVEERDYPIDGVVFADSKPTQKLFVTNPSDFAVKSKKELKKGNDSGIKIDYAESGFGMGNAGMGYSENYERELREKINYVKTPAEIDLTASFSDRSRSATVVSEPVKPVETKPEPAEPIDKNNDVIGNSDDSARSHAESFLNSYADVEDITPEESTESFVAAEPVEVSREPEQSEPIKEEPVISERPMVSRERRITPLFDEDKKDEDVESADEKEINPVTPEQKEVGRSRVVRDGRVRSILFGDDEPAPEEKEEEKGYISRAEKDGNSTERIRPLRDLRAEPETPKEPVPEEKPVKAPPPINREYFRPPLDLLEDYAVDSGRPTDNHQERMQIIADTLAEFGINATPVDYIQGPSVTRYEVKMPAGVSVKKILSYDDDLMAHLAVKDGVRIQAPIPGKNLVGIEVANSHPQTVGLKQVLIGMQGKNIKPESLTFALGKDIVGESMCDDLAKGPHYLIAGTTGSGKSVCIHVMIVSLLMRYSPEDLRIILIDPKRVEFRKYEHLPHLMIDEIINDPKKVLATLSWVVEEMERRYQMFEEAGGFIDGIEAYNKYIANDKVARLPRIVIFIDELADLMCTIKKDLENKIQIIAQKSRAAGIHLVLATQRPSVNVVTGVIKTNLPSRIGLKVSNFQDSQIILDSMGAEKLLGKGDMLYRNSSMPEPERYQGAWIDPMEVKKVVDYIIEHNEAYFNDDLNEYVNRATAVRQDDTVVKADDGAQDGGANGDLLIKALAFAINSGTIAISQIQRRFQVGYARAGGIIDKMEQMGYISGNEGSKARKVLITKEEFEEKYGPMPN